MKDFMNVEIEIGDIVVYPVRRGSTMYLKSATVAEIDKTIVCLSSEGRRVTLLHPRRCVIVKK